MLRLACAEGSSWFGGDGGSLAAGLSAGASPTLSADAADAADAVWAGSIELFFCSTSDGKRVGFCLETGLACFGAAGAACATCTLGT